MEYGDFVVINIVLGSIVSVYAIFAAIQFQYLFAGSGELPYGLSYTYYARRGFFELLFLSGVNILIMLLAVNWTRDEAGAGVSLAKTFCCALCLMTFILLASSYYRMWLYTLDGGLTRLRFLVFGFLVFEALGLAVTFIYILKPQFNIIAVYLALGLTYYLLLNLVPMDSIIARNQINRYFADGKGDTHYALSLSTDAAPEIARLLAAPNPRLADEARNYFTCRRGKYDQFPGWRKFNLSVERCRRIGDREMGG